jgi:hypothetical protein
LIVPRDAQGEKRKRYPIDLFTALIMGHNVAWLNGSGPPG